MPEQLTFDLPAKTAFGRDDFFVSPANAPAVEAIEGWQGWPQQKLLLCGPEGAGKSHLAHIWAGIAHGRVVMARDVTNDQTDTLAHGPLCVENVHSITGDAAAERTLFHLHNLLQQRGVPLLMTGRGLVSEWGIALPDLASRLLAGNTVRLQAPDDGLLSALLVKLFADRQLRVEPGLISYLLPRMDRSFAFARKLVAELDRQALQQKRSIGVKMAGKTLRDLERESD